MSWPLISNPAAVQNANQQLEVFGVGEDGQLHHSIQTALPNQWSNSEIIGRLESDKTIRTSTR